MINQAIFHRGKKLTAWSAIVILLLSSCITVQEASTQRMGADQDFPYPYYDADSKIRYGFQSDDTNFKVLLNTTDPESILKILETGLHIYLDPAGGTNKESFVHYPISAAQNIEQAELKPRDLYTKGITDRLQTLDKEFEYKTPVEQSVTSMFFNKTGINITLSAPTPLELVYELVIPFNKLGTKSVEQLEFMGVGIMTGSFDKKVQNDQNMVQSANPMQMGGQGAPASSNTLKVGSLYDAVSIWCKVRITNP